MPTSSGQPARTRGSPPVMRTLPMPQVTATRAKATISSKRRMSSCPRAHTPSAGMQYVQRRLQRSVIERRR